MSYLRDIFDAKIVATLADGARVFPTVKYDLGHGRACTRISLAGADAPLVGPKTQA
jgi:hypothetical protein